MMNRLNGWQRIGIVISILWVMSAGLYVRNADVDRAGDIYAMTNQTCTKALDVMREAADFSACRRKALDTFNTLLEGSWRNVALVSLTPVPFGWLFIYMLIGIVNWVKLGVKP